MGIKPGRVDALQVSPLPLHPPPFSSITDPTIAFFLLVFPAGQVPFLSVLGLASFIVSMEDGTGSSCMFDFSCGIHHVSIVHGKQARPQPGNPPRQPRGC